MKVKCRRSKHDDDDGNDDDGNVLATALMALIRLIVADIENTAQCLNTVYEHLSHLNAGREHINEIALR